MEHIFCPECGFKNEIKNKFCPGCGSKLNVNTEELINLSNDKDNNTPIENKTIVKDVYSGEEKNGVPHGKGKMIYDNGDVYEGEWFDGKENGYGIRYAYFEDEGELHKEYEGEWKDNKREGLGISYYEDGNKEYEGSWKNDNINGHGILYSVYGYKYYDGEFYESGFNGHGISFDEDGNKEYEGAVSSF